MLIAAIALPVAGCGGGSSTAAKSGQGKDRGSGASQVQFIAEADSICRQVNAEIVSFKAKSTSASEVKRIVPQTLSIERKALVTLTNLKPPASLGASRNR